MSSSSNIRIHHLTRESIETHINTTLHLENFNIKHAFEEMKRLRAEEFEKKREQKAKEILISVLLVFSNLSTSKHHTMDEKIYIEHHPYTGISNLEWIQNFLVNKLEDMFSVIIEDVPPIIRGCPITDQKMLIIKRKNT